MRHRNRGFSLIELMITLLVLSVIMGAIFQLMRLAMSRSATEQAKLDMFQEAREFMDQMARDLRQAGYPNPRNYASSGVITQNPAANDTKVASGVTYIDSNELWFEGDVDGSGTVSVVKYKLEATGTNCPCLRRSQLPKVVGNPITAQTATNFQVEVQNVVTSNTQPIFGAYVHASSGSAVTLPVTFNANGATVAQIEIIKAILTIQAAAPDAQTGQRPLTTLVSTVKLNNCSLAATGKAMSCQ